MKHLHSLCPIYGGALQVQDKVMIHRAWSMSWIPGVFAAQFSQQSPYMYPSPEVVHYLGLCKITIPLSYNPHMAFTRKSAPLL